MNWWLEVVLTSTCCWWWYFQWFDGWITINCCWVRNWSLRMMFVVNTRMIKWLFLLFFHPLLSFSMSTTRDISSTWFVQVTFGLQTRGNTRLVHVTCVHLHERQLSGDQIRFDGTWSTSWSSSSNQLILSWLSLMIISSLWALSTMTIELIYSVYQMVSRTLIWSSTGSHWNVFGR